MKINIKQLDNDTREGVATALQLYAASIYPEQVEARKKYRDLSVAVRHGELLLCDYASEWPQDDVKVLGGIDCDTCPYQCEFKKGGE